MFDRVLRKYVINEERNIFFFVHHHFKTSFFPDHFYFLICLYKYFPSVRHWNHAMWNLGTNFGTSKARTIFIYIRIYYVILTPLIQWKTNNADISPNNLPICIAALKWCVYGDSLLLVTCKSIYFNTTNEKNVRTSIRLNLLDCCQ